MVSWVAMLYKFTTWQCVVLPLHKAMSLSSIGCIPVPFQIQGQISLSISYKTNDALPQAVLLSTWMGVSKIPTVQQ